MPYLEEIKNLRILNNEDLSNSDFSEIVSYGRASIDIETTGLDWKSNRLATIQIYSDDLAIIYKEGGSYPTNLIELLRTPLVEKIFHHAMFDVRFITKLWDIKVTNVSCTKVASKILNKNQDEHSLKQLLLTYLNIDIEKDMYDSNWLNNRLTEDQIRYAMNDVIYLEPLFDKIVGQISSHQLKEVSKASFDFIPYYAWLQVNGYEGVFKH